MKKTIKVENLDCANCASKITQKIKLELIDENYNTIMKEIKRVCKKVEPDCTLLDD